MSLDLKKSNSSRSPVLIAGLLIMCLYLLCNWWSLSSQNAELIKELDNLVEQLKINGDELGKCTQERFLLDEKLKDSQNRFVQQQIKMDEVKESEDEVKQSYQKIETELVENKKKSELSKKNLGLCQAEMESLKKLGESKDKATETLRSENESLKSEIQQKEKLIKELEKQIKNFNKTGDLLSKNKFMQSLVKNYNANMKKNLPDTGNVILEKDNNNKGFANFENIKKFEEATLSRIMKKEKENNYADPGLLSLENDPREEEMKGS